MATVLLKSPDSLLLMLMVLVTVLVMVSVTLRQQEYVLAYALVNYLWLVSASPDNKYYMRLGGKLQLLDLDFV